MSEIAIVISYKDRPAELGLLLQSLRTQTYQDFEVFVLDDGSKTPPVANHFIACMISRMKCEGHRMEFIRNDKSVGVARGRQQLVEHVLDNSECKYLCRIDDDVVIDPNYLEELIKGIMAGYDIVSGVTPPMQTPICKRSTEYVKPLINKVVLDKEGKFLINGDDCGYLYLEHEIIPTHHFRSSMLAKRTVHEKIQYEDNMTPCGFREEEFFSFRSILKGFTLCVNTAAITWHLQSGGGDRRSNYQELAMINQKMLNRFTRKKFKQYGNFIEKYNEKLKIKDKNPLDGIEKATNLVITTEEI